MKRITQRKMKRSDKFCNYIFRGFIKGWQPGKLTGSQLDHAWLLLLPDQVVFLQESVNINNLCPPVKTDYPPVQILNETPAY